jgi:hypothetical protein
MECNTALAHVRRSFSVRRLPRYFPVAFFETASQSLFFVMITLLCALLEGSQVAVACHFCLFARSPSS